MSFLNKDMYSSIYTWLYFPQVLSQLSLRHPISLTLPNMSATHRSCRLTLSRSADQNQTMRLGGTVIKQLNPLSSLWELLFNNFGISRLLHVEQLQQPMESSRPREMESRRLRERELHRLDERPLTVCCSKPNTILKLRFELLPHIVSFLSIDAVASLALTCRAFYQVIGAQSFEKLNEKNNILQKVRFLQYMVDDFPSYALCSTCAVLHKIQPNDDQAEGRLCRLGNHCIGLCRTRLTSRPDRGKLQLNLGLLTIDWRSAMFATRAHLQPSIIHSRPQFDTYNTSLFDSDLARGTEINGIYHSIRARLWRYHIIIRMTMYVPLSLHFQSSSLYHLRKPFPLLMRCRHMCNIINDDLEALLREARKTPQKCNPDMGPTFTELESARSFCRFCPSEYKVCIFRTLDIDQEVAFSTAEPYVLVLDRWIDLGRFGHPASREFEALAMCQICCDHEGEHRLSYYNGRQKHPHHQPWGWGREWPNMISISGRYRDAEEAM